MQVAFLLNGPFYRGGEVPVSGQDHWQLAWNHEGRKAVAGLPKGTYKPGQHAPKSGQVKETGSKTEKTVVKGEPMPPTSGPGKKYVYTDVTKHKDS
jgi:hypothetical protein